MECILAFLAILVAGLFLFIGYRAGYNDARIIYDKNYTEWDENGPH